MSKIYESLLQKQIILSAGLDFPAGSQFRCAGSRAAVEEQLTASQQLKYLVIPFAGLPEETRAYVSENPSIRVFNLHHNAQLPLNWRCHCCFPLQNLWFSMINSCAGMIGLSGIRPPILDFLSGKTVVIVGYGQIGRRVAASVPVLE